ncbi:MAG: Gamma-glutamyl phosphate reductase [Fibrobacterota bacterium]|jgi:glutamate-5-semialdehyde dehydrogenase
MTELVELAARLARQTREAARLLAAVPSPVRVRAIEAAADLLEARAAEVVAANALDLEAGRAAGLAASMLDRLKLDSKRIAAIAQAMREIAAQPDPVGRVLSEQVRPDGLRISKISVPLGAVFIIYESRPNVTCDAAALCLKSGNATLLRGGKEARHTNGILADLLTEAFRASGLPEHAMQLVRETDRQLVNELLRCERDLDLVIPRGGESLIRAVADATRIPMIKHYKGVCHVYLHKNADADKARVIVLNAKTQRPGVCNAMETLLLDHDLPEATGRRVLSELAQAGVELRVCAATKSAWPDLPLQLAGESDWDEEYLALILAVRQVDGLTGALDHIALHASGHTEAIVTEDAAVADAFVLGCDSASVMVNASTRFADGGEYGLGAEIGISTDKLHARGPMGAFDLTTYKWVVRGQGHVRG